MSESSAAFALGTTASILFVVSHIPQLCRRAPSDDVSVSLLLLQFVSGILWIVYGVLESTISILVFGALSTVFCCLLLVRLVCVVRRASSFTLVLAGGGRLPSAVWRRMSGRVVVVPWAKDDPVAGERAARRALWLHGCRPARVDELATTRAIWFTGGCARRLRRRVDQSPELRAALARIARSGGVVGGTSAGAVVLAQMGLFPRSVCTHGNECPGACSLDEGTALVVTDGVTRVVGAGGVRFS